MSRTLLLVGGGLEGLPGVRRAREMGLRVLVSDRDPDAPGARKADGFLHADTYDPTGTLAAARAYAAEHGPIHGVLAIAADVPHTVAEVAHGLGLPGIPREAARRAVDKLAMKERFAAAGVPVPWFAPVPSAADLQSIARREGLPLVVKPVDSRGARGVLRLTEAVDLAWAFDHARAHSPTGRVMVERYLTGPQVSTESLVIDGTAHTPGFSDRNYEYLERFAPHIIENGGELPSHLDANTQARVRAVVEAAARALGVENGVVKGDIVVSGGEVYVIELAARLSGGYFCSHEIPLNTGVDFVGAAIRQALGDPVDPSELVPRFQRAVVQRYLFPTPGRVRSVSVPDWLATDPNLPLCEVRVRPGDVVGPIHSHPARGGVVISTGPDRAAALAKATAAIDAIRIESQ